MSSPITPVLPGSSSYGLAWKQVTVMSVDGNIATVRDQISATFHMDRTKLRAKCDPPEVGETWIVDRSYGNEWTFALIVGKPIPIPRPPQVYSVVSQADRDSIQSPDDGMVVYRIDRGYHEQYSATTSTWSALPRTGLIRRWDPTADLSIPAGTETLDPDTTVTFSANSARRYKLSYTTRFSQTNAGTMTINFRYIAGNGPLLTTSTSWYSHTVVGNGGNFSGLSGFKVLPASLSGTYTIGVTFFSGSGAGASTAYGSSGLGRTLILEDIGVPQQ